MYAPDIARRRAEPVELIGRDTEWTRVRAFLGAEPTFRSMLVSGPAGIGKSALWTRSVAWAADSDIRTLSARPAEFEQGLPFAALGDLLVELAGSGLESLPEPQRLALEVALLLRSPQGQPADARTLGVAVATLLRTAAQQQPVLIAIDDAQWLDHPSAGALDFALRRLTDAPIATLMTVRSTHLGDLPLPSVVRACERLELGPLTLGAIQRLVASATGNALTPSVLRRIHDRSHGNPLHALELARAVSPDCETLDGAAAFAPPEDLADLVRTRLLRLTDSTRQTLLVIACLSRATIDLVRRARPGVADRDLACAIDAGLVTLHGSRVRFAHPLFASVCYREAPVALRQAAHAELAELAAELEERARHLALATTGEDAASAEVVDAGARHARARGAPDTAAQLAELALRLTPQADVALRCDRGRLAARWHLEAGEPVRARRLLEGLLDLTPDGAERARTLIALAVVLYEQAGPAAVRCAATEAIAAARDDPDVLPEAHLCLAARGHLPVDERLSHASRALEVLERSDQPDPAVLARALREIALSTYHLGRGMPRDIMARAARLEESLPEPPPVAWRAETCLGECLKYLDEYGEAERLLIASSELADRQGDVGSLAGVLGHRAELSLWLGRWQEAQALAAEAVELASQIGQHGRLALAGYYQSLVAAHVGDTLTARRFAATALAASRRADDGWATAQVGWGLGFLALSEGNAEEAVRQLRAVDAFASKELVTEPRQWRYLGDYVEALVATGAVAAATERLVQLQQWADHAATPWPRALALRSDAVVTEATGDRCAAVDRMRAAVDQFAGLPLPFEHARTWFALGAMQRRAGQRAAARTSLGQAASGFRTLGARLWAGRAQEELARLGGRTPAGSNLTPSERAVADLVGQGLTNKQVAAALVVTPRTVEAHLTRIYAKRGLRSRAELVHLLAGSR
jgi:DNA-binding CsgD family transcriptional regulator